MKTNEFFSKNEFSCTRILSALDKLGIEYKTTGKLNDVKFEFMSLMNVEQGGVYYLAGAKVMPDSIANSIVIHDGLAVCDNAESIFQIVVSEPQLVFYRLMQELAYQKSDIFGVHPTAIVSPAATIHDSAYIGPYCIVEEAFIGKNVKLHSHVVVRDRVYIDDDTCIESHSTLGATGVAWVWDQVNRVRVKQPQIGYTYIGKNVFLGTDVTIVRGSVNESTTVGAGSVIAHGSKIGHGARLGAECHFANNVSIAGNVVLGDRTFMGAGSVVRPQVKIADDCVIGAGSVVVHNNESSGTLMIGVPAKIKKIDSNNRLKGVPTSLTQEN
ncbi:DapH/DapD/GlmU-related protein [Simiduia aestuariiviva]|uniref:UDP-3-O-[3-hydroxymyristoyl] glucosamine N-acyltransferase n=1 Tax=Simiduia aestuariiviva TaxID=1510459 RepID=A0A839UNP2_9GAMM|nr:DapH/DapD/GlmU-related protein [Simiduia aestuariiviva]MBB3168361.1 UDP-3-O-[3-hydroxymyristoyl] glucosamine N-acyltransferase [Simiduia aestuariiviva]